MDMLITDAYTLTAEDTAALEALGLTVLRCSDTEAYAGDPSRIVLVACKLLFSYDDIDRFTSLRYVQIAMAGFDHMPMDKISARGMEFHNARDVYSDPIAEFGIAGLLSLYKQLRRFERQQRGRVWEIEPRLLELEGKDALILGAGSIGAAFAKRLRAFGCHVTGLARTAGPREHFDEVLAMDRLDDCLPTADIVILCLPNDPSTRHIMGAAQFGRVKPGAYLINIARGALVDEQALIPALQSGRLGGAVLDVFETEPLPEDSPLWEMENVVLSPHTSYGAEFNARRNLTVLLRNLRGSALLKDVR